MVPAMEPEALMEPRPKDRIPENPLRPLVRGVVFNAIADSMVYPRIGPDVAALLTLDITNRLCETIDQDGWDQSDRIRRASTKLTWGAEPDGECDHPYP